MRLYEARASSLSSVVFALPKQMTLEKGKEPKMKMTFAHTRTHKRPLIDKTALTTNAQFAIFLYRWPKS